MLHYDGFTSITPGLDEESWVTFCGQKMFNITCTYQLHVHVYVYMYMYMCTCTCSVHGKYVYSTLALEKEREIVKEETALRKEKEAVCCYAVQGCIQSYNYIYRQPRRLRKPHAHTDRHQIISPYKNRVTIKDEN